MKVTARVVEIKELPDNAHVRENVARALSDVAHQCLADANTTVPLEDGPLQGSGHADADGLTAQVTYGTPYAVYQHETLHLRHDEGRRAQWLELTVYENQDRYVDHVAKAARQG